MSLRSFDLSHEEALAIYEALTAQANYIETGTVILSARDVQQRIAAERQDPHPLHRRTSQYEVKALDTEQMRRVVLLRDLAQRFFEHGTPAFKPLF